MSEYAQSRVRAGVCKSSLQSATLDRRKKAKYRHGGQKQSKDIFKYDPLGVCSSRPSYPNVRETEDAISTQLQAGSQIHISMPKRPGFGSRGAQTILYANYFHLLIPSGCDVFRYNLETEQSHGARKLRQIIGLLLDEHFPEARDYIASDLGSTLVSPFDILGGDTAHIFDVRYKDDFAHEYPSTPTTFRVRVIPTGKISVSSLVHHLSSMNASDMCHNKVEVLHALTVILGHFSRACSNIVPMEGNKRFAISGDLVERFSLGAGLEVLRGFSFSARAATARLLVGCQVEYSLCFQGARLAEVIAAYRREASPSIIRLERFLRRLQVELIHYQQQENESGYTPRYKVVAGLASPSDGRTLPHPPIVPRHGCGPRELRFWLQDPTRPVDESSDIEMGEIFESSSENGRYVTVEEYFVQRYGIYTDPNLPVVRLLARSKNPSYVPAEVCIVRSGQPAAVHLSAEQEQRIMDIAIRSPAENARSIVTKGSELLGFSIKSNSILKNFGFQISPGLVNVPGRILQSPAVLYADGNKADVSSGVWRQNGTRFYKPGRVSSWAFIYIVNAKDREIFKTRTVLYDCLTTLRSKLKHFGVEACPISDGRRVDVTAAYDHGNYNTSELDQIIGGSIAHLLKTHKLDLILAVLSSPNSHIYSSVKRVCDVQLGVNNVCMLAAKLAKQNEQFLGGVCLKINLKLGGVNQVLGKERSGIISEGKTMIVGIDVTHPASGSASDTPSVAGMVASIDRHLAQWPADIQIQTSRQETGAPLDRMLKSRLELWAAANTQLPENIIVYRDGVSNSQYEQVVTDEIPLLKSACGDIYPQISQGKGLPRLSVIIVCKRHRTRFYPTREGDADKLSNPKNGTVIDRGLTEAREWDFYLQSHTALHGTARPAHYYVVWDEIFRARKPTPPLRNAADILENFTHDLCYLFGRATRAVSICPPAYYADLLCDRARCYLKDVFDGRTQRGTSREETEITYGELVMRSEKIQVHSRLRKSMFYI
ncbi:putative RNA interference and gene silencing protein [Aspergillus granulosus]|uniref:RNA interference and gene silencing protein n=1 Tax=Aspergillus granulosus TaxID=176169 RepID=A0ABR4GVZ1_9EURO